MRILIGVASTAPNRIRMSSHQWLHPILRFRGYRVSKIETDEQRGGCPELASHSRYGVSGDMDYDELWEEFGEDLADAVATLTKDEPGKPALQRRQILGGVGRCSSRRNFDRFGSKSHAEAARSSQRNQESYWASTARCWATNPAWDDQDMHERGIDSPRNCDDRAVRSQRASHVGNEEIGYDRVFIRTHSRPDQRFPRRNPPMPIAPKNTMAINKNAARPQNSWGMIEPKKTTNPMTAKHPIVPKPHPSPDELFMLSLPSRSTFS